MANAIQGHASAWFGVDEGRVGLDVESSVEIGTLIAIGAIATYVIHRHYRLKEHEATLWARVQEHMIVVGGFTLIAATNAAALAWAIISAPAENLEAVYGRRRDDR